MITMEGFSKRENAIIKILNFKSKKTYHGIAKELFADKADGILDSEIIVGNTVRRIIKKCNHRGLDWTIEKIRKNGRVHVRKIRRK